MTHPRALRAPKKGTDTTSQQESYADATVSFIARAKKRTVTRRERIPGADASIVRSKVLPKQPQSTLHWNPFAIAASRPSVLDEPSNKQTTTATRIFLRTHCGRRSIITLNNNSSHNEQFFTALLPQLPSMFSTHARLPSKGNPRLGRACARTTKDAHRGVPRVKGYDLHGELGHLARKPFWQARQTEPNP